MFFRFDVDERTWLKMKGIDRSASFYVRVSKLVVREYWTLEILPLL